MKERTERSVVEPERQQPVPARLDDGIERRLLRIKWVALGASPLYQAIIGDLSIELNQRTASDVVWNIGLAHPAGIDLGLELCVVRKLALTAGFAFRVPSRICMSAGQFLWATAYHRQSLRQLQDRGCLRFPDAETRLTSQYGCVTVAMF